MAKKVNKYLIHRIGIGEIEIMFVDKDIWDWLEYNCKSPCPDRLADAIWKELGDYGDRAHDTKEDMVKWLSRQTPDNRSTYVTFLEKVFFNMKDAINYMNKNNFSVIDEMQLVIC
jgi:hypothetical protein